MNKEEANKLQSKLKRQALEDLFAHQLRASKIAVGERNFRFHPSRRWAFDFAWVSLRVAVEIDGGVYSQGRHTRGSGFTKDCEKLNEATRLGWQVYRFTGEQVLSGEAIAYMAVILAP